MIISHKYRFIFIKTHKTAGSSIERLLSDLCGPDDILTTMDPAPEGHRPRNWIGNSWLDRAYARHLRVRKLIHRDSLFLGHHYYQHMAGARVRKLCGEEVWDSYFKFCFERNSWDKVVSFYWWKMRERDELVPFSLWLREKKLPVDSELYYVNGEQAMDCIGHFEQLGDHLRQIFERIGLPTDLELPREKIGINRTRQHYTELYSEGDREYVAERFAREIELMGYGFGEPVSGGPVLVTSGK